MHSKSIMATVSLLLVVTAEAALYRWEDDQGVVHFSDQPPPRHATGSTMMLDVPQPASGSVPLTGSIQDRSRGVSAASVRKKSRDRRVRPAKPKAAGSATSGARRSTAPYSARSTTSKRIRTTY